MPLVVNGNENIWFVNLVKGIEENQAKRLIVDGIEVWNRFDMEEKVEITARLNYLKGKYMESIRINNITPYPITITKVEGSLLNNGTKSIFVSGGGQILSPHQLHLFQLLIIIVFKLHIPVMGIHM